MGSAVGCSDVDVAGHLTIPEGMVSLGDGMFSACLVLTSVTIPSTVSCVDWRIVIQETACQSFKHVRIAAVGQEHRQRSRAPTNRSPGSTCSSSVTITSLGAFYRCTSLSTVTLPSAIRTIGDWAFQERRLYRTHANERSHPYRLHLSHCRVVLRSSRSIFRRQ